MKRWSKSHLILEQGMGRKKDYSRRGSCAIVYFLRYFGTCTWQLLILLVVNYNEPHKKGLGGY